MMRYILLLVAMLSVAPAEPSRINAQTSARFNSVVRIRVVTMGGDTLYGNGTVVGPLQVVTVRTLLSSARSIEVVDRQNGASLRATIANVDTVSEVALLRVPNLQLSAIGLARRVAAIGDSISLVTVMRDSAPNLRPSRIRKIETFAGGSLIALPLSLDEEATGAPIMNAAGELVAITYATEQDGIAQTWGIPARHVQELLTPVASQARAVSASPSTSAPAKAQTAPPSSTRPATAATQTASTKATPAEPISGESGSPYWIHQGGRESTTKSVIPTPRLIGKTFLFVPDVAPELRPRYDYRVLLTFGANRLEARKVLGAEAYAVSYETHTFRFAKMAAKVNFGVAMDYYDQLYLRASPGSERPTYVPGLLRELKNMEAGQFRTYIASADAAERARQAQERRAGQTVPLPQLETFDLSGSRAGVELIRKIYYGQFDALNDPRFNDSRPENKVAQALVTNSAVNNLLRTYHEEYSEFFGDRIAEPVVSLRSDWVTYDRWGNELDRSKGHAFRIRTRYAGEYRAAIPGVGDVFGMMLRSFDNGDKQIDFSRMADEMFVGTACRAFLERYAASNPATVARFEENLARAFSKQSPLVINEPANRMDLGSNPLRLPGEVLLPVREVLTEEGVSWTRPAGWKKFTRGYGAAVYGVGTPASVEVIVTRLPKMVDSLLPYLNMWRERERLAPIAREGEQPMERLTVDGRSAILISYKGSTQVMIHDGAQTWIVTMYGWTRGVADGMSDLRAFVNSFVFTDTGVKAPEEEAPAPAGRAVPRRPPR
ncbi:MAG: hypothetical protein H7Z40_11340 [Phycisphaerae bacterium]|nr:hypothetical protein [Gemmatimonadaceae bacterium]